MTNSSTSTPALSFQTRMADTLLRNIGGRTVLLHIPAPATPGDLGEQLGLAAPGFQDVELGPVVFRRIRAATGSSQTARAASGELLVSASAVAKIVGSLAFQAADVLFQQASGVLVDDTFYAIAWVASAEAFGTVYLYRLGLRAAIASLT